MLCALSWIAEDTLMAQMAQWYDSARAKIVLTYHGELLSMGGSPTLRSAARIAILLAAFAPTHTARGQTTSMSDAVSQVADAISDSKDNSVVVFDFSGPGDMLTSLGQHLADEFSEVLSKSSQHFRVLDRALIAKTISEEKFTAEGAHDFRLNSTVASELKTKSYVSGVLSLDQGSVKVFVLLAHMDLAKKPASFRFEMPVTEEMKKSLTGLVAVLPDSSIPNAGSHGFSTPLCIFCPKAEYTADAARNKAAGLVILGSVVTADGQVSDIHVLKSLPFGLTEAAIQMIRTWKLRPAIGPDGKPAAVRQVIEVTFEL
jgi:TonB family protein